MPTPLRHLAISPDGNRRWATSHGLDAADGYRNTLSILPGLVDTTRDNGIEYLSLHGMNHASWDRPADEIGKVMATVTSFVDQISPQVIVGDTSLTWVGFRDQVPSALREKIERLESASNPDAGLHIALYLDYDPRAHILAAGGDFDRLTPTNFPEVDLYVRTSSDLRTSSFDPLRIAHAELAFVAGGFPDFTPDRLAEVIAEYRTRDRRFSR